jgi:hypothetical protein
VFVELVEYLFEDFDDTNRAFDHVWRKVNGFFSGDISFQLALALAPPGPLRDDGSSESDLPEPAELGHLGQPIELLPFCWNGGDALHYGWAVLAPELDSDDHCCVSFAPEKEAAVWLGDNTREALENLLAATLVEWQESGSDCSSGPPRPMTNVREYIGQLLSLCDGRSVAATARDRR